MIGRFLVAAILCAMLSCLLDGLGFKARRLFVTLCLIMLLICGVSSMSDMFSGLGELAERFGVGDAAATALRAVGLGYVVSFTADICTSLGEGTLSSVVVMVGRIEIFLVAYPYFEETAKLAISLIE